MNPNFRPMYPKQIAINKLDKLPYPLIAQACPPGVRAFLCKDKVYDEFGNEIINSFICSRLQMFDYKLKAPLDGILHFRFDRQSLFSTKAKPHIMFMVFDTDYSQLEGFKDVSYLDRLAFIHKVFLNLPTEECIITVPSDTQIHTPEGAEIYITRCATNSKVYDDSVTFKSLNNKYTYGDASDYWEVKL